MIVQCIIVLQSFLKGSSIPIPLTNWLPFSIELSEPPNFVAFGAEILTKSIFSIIKAVFHGVQDR